MGEDRYFGEVYIIVPEKKSHDLSDLTVLRMADELHNTKKINNALIKKAEKFRLLEAYCAEKKIEFSKVEDNADLVDEITRHYGKPSRRFFYATRQETEDSLAELISKLADCGFYSEFRIPHSF